MTEDNRKGGSGFLLGVAVGAAVGAVGAVAALLLVPKGRELRQNAADTVRTAGEKTRELAAEAGHKAKETAKRASETAVDLGGKAVDVAVQTAHTAAAVKDNVQGWVKDLRTPGMIDITNAGTADSRDAGAEAEAEAAAETETEAEAEAEAETKNALDAAKEP